eukprot:gene18846-25398_t
MKLKCKKIVRLFSACLSAKELKKSFQSESDSPFTIDAPRDKEVSPRPEVLRVKKQLQVPQALPIELTNEASHHEAHAKKLQSCGDTQRIQMQRLDSEVAQAVADVKLLQVKAEMNAANSAESQIEPGVVSVVSLTTPSSPASGSGSAVATPQNQATVTTVHVEAVTVAAPQSQATATSSKVKADEDLDKAATKEVMQLQERIRVMGRTILELEEGRVQEGAERKELQEANYQLRSKNMFMAMGIRWDLKEGRVQEGAKMMDLQETIHQLEERKILMFKVILELMEGRAQDGAKMKELQERNRVMDIAIQQFEQLEESRVQEGVKMRELRAAAHQLLEKNRCVTATVVQQLKEGRVEDGEKRKELQNMIRQLQEESAAQERDTIQVRLQWTNTCVKLADVEEGLAKAAAEVEELQESNNASETLIQHLQEGRVQEPVRRGQMLDVIQILALESFPLQKFKDDYVVQANSTFLFLEQWGIATLALDELKEEFAQANATMQQLQESKDASVAHAQRLEKIIKDGIAEKDNRTELLRAEIKEKGYKIIELEAQLFRQGVEADMAAFEKVSPSVAAGREEVMRANMACQTDPEVMGANVACQADPEVMGANMACQTDPEVMGANMACQTDPEVMGAENAAGLILDQAKEMGQDTDKGRDQVDKPAKVKQDPIQQAIIQDTPTQADKEAARDTIRGGLLTKRKSMWVDYQGGCQDDSGAGKADVMDQNPVKGSDQEDKPAKVKQASNQQDTTSRAVYSDQATVLDIAGDLHPTIQAEAQATVLDIAGDLHPTIQAEAQATVLDIAGDLHPTIQAEDQATVLDIAGDLHPTIQAEALATVLDVAGDLHPTIQAKDQATVLDVAGDLHPTIQAKDQATVLDVAGDLHPTIQAETHSTVWDIVNYLERRTSTIPRQGPVICPGDQATLRRIIRGRDLIPGDLECQL